MQQRSSLDVCGEGGQRHRERHHNDGMSHRRHRAIATWALTAARSDGRGSLEWQKRAGVRSFGRRANFFEKTGAQWHALAAFRAGRPSLLHPQHGWRLLLPPSDKGKGSILSHSSQTQVWAIAC